jgi:DNA mismatch repair protein MutS
MHFAAMNRVVVTEYFAVREQYLNKYGPRTVLLFEIGSFYEIYDKTNEIDVICNILNIQRTRHDKRASLDSLEKSPYLCGFPVHALQKFLRILTQHNYVVVVYNQRDDPNARNKKIRVLQDIYSGATVLDDVPIENQVILNIYLEFDETNKLIDTSICHTDVTTGKSECVIFSRIQFSEICKIIAIYTPRQVIIHTENCKFSKDELIDKLRLGHRNLVHVYLESVHKDLKKVNYQNAFLGKVFSTNMITPIEYLNLERHPSMVVSYILLLNFIYEHNHIFLVKLSPPKIVNIGDIVDLSENAIHQLNLVRSSGQSGSAKSSVFDVINKTSTPGGQRLLRERLLNPITDRPELEIRYNNIEKMLPVIEQYEIHLGNIRDLERLHRKIHLGKLQPPEFVQLEVSHVAVAHLMGLSAKDQICSNLLNRDLIAKFYALYALYHEYLIMDNLAKYNLDDDFTLPIFRPGHYTDMDELYTQSKTSWAALKEYARNLATSIGDETALRYEQTTVQGYYFVTTKKKKSLLAAVDPSLEFKDQASNVKVSSPTIQRLSTQILETQLAINKLTIQKYSIFLAQISAEYAEALEHITVFTNNIDICKSAAKVAKGHKYCKPVIINNTKSFIKAKNVRHAILEIIDSSQKYIPNDVSIGADSDGMLLYGLNSSGKSTYGRSVGMTIVLAMCGFYVPAESFTYSPYKRIITKIAIQDDLFGAKSTFVNEMLHLKDIIETADAETFVIADELCSGTEYSSALSIVASTVIELSNRKTSFIFATHFHELADLAGIKDLPNVKVFHTAVTIDPDRGLIFNRILKPGKCPDKYGLEIAAHMKLDPGFINRAMKIRSNYDEEVGSLTNCKPSTYNSKVYVDQCRVCAAVKNLVVHHIVAQREFDENSCIPYRKNIEHNLVVLCEDCHHRVHNSKTLVINGYIQTSQGLVLDHSESDANTTPISSSVKRRLKIPYTPVKAETRDSPPSSK